LLRKDRIETHFLICFIALALVRVLSIKVNYKYSVTKIRQSLKNTTVSYISQNYYVTNNVDEITLDMEKNLEIQLNKKYLTEQEIIVLAGSVKKH
jgi:hypothetical protein